HGQRNPSSDRGKEGLSAEGPQGIRLLREGKRRQTQRGACWCWLCIFHDLHAAQFDPECEADIGALQWRRRGHERAGGWSGRLYVRRRGALHFTVTGRHDQGFAVGTAERNPMLPNVPTSNEAGLPEFQASAWNGLFAPKATPKPVLERLAGALEQA